MQPLHLKLNDSCGRLHCGRGWGREREASLRLNDLEFWLVWKGQGWMRTATRDFVLLPGFCAIMRPGGIYDAGHNDENPLGITYIHFDAIEPKSSQVISAGVSKPWPEFFEVDDLPYFDSVTRRIVQLAARNPALGATILHGLVLDLLQRPPLGEAVGTSLDGGHERAISVMVSQIRSSADPAPTVAEMAARVHLSPAHFSRLFKKTIGQSPRDFVLDTRLGRARHLLRETNLSIGEIAERLDYADVFFFSRQFKEKTGISPLAYRKRS